MPITRASLLIRIREDSDPTGWDEFVRAYTPLIRGFALRAGIPEQDAGDLVQEILLRLLRALPEFAYSPERGRFRAWLRTLCRNAVMDWHRRESQHRTCAPPSDAFVAFNSNDPQWDWEHRRHILRHAMRAVREQVSNDAWYCFDRHVLQGYAAAQVAREMRTTPAAVYVIATRIRARLRQKCAQFDEELV